jgi:hypothetical protein
MDKIQKQKGRPNSMSRKEEKANKKNTHKARRQEGKKAIHLTDF